MATATRHDPLTTPNRMVYRAAVLGVVAGSAFGVLIQFGLGMMGTIGALVTLGEPSVSIGWVVHVTNSALFGALFGLLVERGPLRRHVLRPTTAPVVGAAYGLALFSVNIVFLWPAALDSLVGFAAPSVPYFAVGPLVGHLLYGSLLGLLVALFAGED